MNRQLQLRATPRYGVITMTLPCRCQKNYVEVGPVLAASYDRQVFEVLHPFRAVLRPLDFCILETFGHLDSPLQAYQRYEGWQAEHPPQLLERAAGEEARV